MERKVVFPRALEYLLAIAEHGSYTRAAEVLRVSQPSMSQQIKQLEETLQTSLLDRSGRKVRLTDAGEIYLHHARRAWGEMSAATHALRDVQNLSRGSLRLGWTPITDYLTYSLLEEFNSHYPSITISTLEMPQDDIEVAVAEDKIDIGIAFSEPLAAGARSNEIDMKLLFEETLCLAVGKAQSPARQRRRMRAKDLEAESLALLNPNFALRRDIDRYCQEQRVTPRVTIESNSLSVIVEMIRMGPLATVLPKSIIRTQCGLHAIALSPQLPRKAITLLYRKGGYKSPACLAFSELASDWATRRLDAAAIRRQIPCPFSEAPTAATNEAFRSAQEPRDGALSEPFGNTR